MPGGIFLKVVFSISCSRGCLGRVNVAPVGEGFGPDRDRHVCISHVPICSHWTRRLLRLQPQSLTREGGVGRERERERETERERERERERAYVCSHKLLRSFKTETFFLFL